MLFDRARSCRVGPRFSVNVSKYLRNFTTYTTLQKKPLPPRPKLDDATVEAKALKGSGPGGQKINKTNSAIQMTHLPTGIVVKSQATRSRSQNYKIAREILAEKIELLEKGDESRAAKKIEVKSKRKASAAKKAKRKYRKLEDEKRSGESTAAEFVEKEEESKDSETALNEGTHTYGA